MAEDTVVKEMLTEQMIEAGAQLTESLDGQNWPLVGALWLFDPEINQWRLLLASPTVKTEGAFEAYHHVNEALRESTSPLRLDSVSVVSPDHPIFRTLASALRPGWENRTRRVFRTAINGHYIDDAYVYRLPPLAPAA